MDDAAHEKGKRKPPEDPAPGLQVQVDAVSVNFTRSPVVRKAPTLVLIHGFAASLESWHDLYELLKDHYDVVRLDLKGSGFSIPAAVNGHQYTAEAQAELLLEFLRKIEVRNVVLVGHSLGGGVTLMAYLRWQERPQDLDIKALVLMDSAGYPLKLPFFITAVRNPVTRLLSYLVPPEKRARRVLSKIFGVKSQVTEDRVHRYAYFMTRPYCRRALVKTAKTIVPKNLAEINEKFRSIAVPTLILWGANDPVIPREHADRFAQDIGSHARLVVLEDTGHVPHEERPNEVFRVLTKFIRGSI